MWQIKFDMLVFGSRMWQIKFNMPVSGTGRWQIKFDMPVSGFGKITKRTHFLNKCIANNYN
jgi:hypothetical protein